MTESPDRCPGKPRGGCYRAPVHRNHRLTRLINWRHNLPLLLCRKRVFMLVPRAAQVCWAGPRRLHSASCNVVCGAGVFAPVEVLA